MTYKPLSYYAAGSLCLHIVVVALFMLVSYVFLQDQLNIRKENLKLVEASVRVDMVALPDRTLKELRSLQQLQKSVPKKAEPVVTKSAPVPSDGKEFIDTKKAPKKSLSDMLKKYSDKKVKQAKEVKKKKNANSNGLSGKDLSKLTELVKKGNKVKAGVALAGGDSQAILTALEEYSAKLPEIVRPYWKLPSYLIEQDLRCRIRIFLKKDGSILRKSIFKSSGDDEYDQKAMSAIKQVKSFPEVPKSIQAKVLRGAIVLAFPL